MKLLFVGDIMLGRLVNQALKQTSEDYPWGDTLSILNTADIRIGNLECVISDVGEPWSSASKIFHFRTDEKNIKSLLTANFNIVSLANNHILDYEYEGLSRTVKILAENNIGYAGAGEDEKSAKKSLIYDYNSKKIGFIAFTDNEPTWEAKKNLPGVFYVPIDEKDSRAQELFNLIKKTRTEVDILIVSAHWGPNWGYEPPPEHITFAHHIIDAGADILFGHSGHVFRGVEIYKNKAILYCAGDFVDDYAVDEVERNDESFIYVFDIENNAIVRIMFYPTIIRDFQARLAKDLDKEMLMNKMQNLCEQLGTKSLQKNNYLEIVIPENQKHV